jgi:hypothetical protein
MPAITDHVQFDEVLRRLNDERACAIVHPQTLREVIVWADRKSGWAAQAAAKDEPPADTKAQLAAQGFRVERDDRAAAPLVMYRVYGEFPDAAADGRAGLALFQVLWNVAADEWLWVTDIEYDKRGTMPPHPNPLPPRGT